MNVTESNLKSPTPRSARYGFGREKGPEDDIATGLCSFVGFGLVRTILLFDIWNDTLSGGDFSNLLLVGVLTLLVVRENAIDATNCASILFEKSVLFHNYRYAHTLGDIPSTLSFFLTAFIAVLIAPFCFGFGWTESIFPNQEGILGQILPTNISILLGFFLIKLWVRDASSIATFIRYAWKRYVKNDRRFNPFQNLPKPKQLSFALIGVFLFTPSIVSLYFLFPSNPEIKEHLQLIPNTYLILFYILTRQNISDAFSLAYWWSDYKVTPREEAEAK